MGLLRPCSGGAPFGAREAALIEWADDLAKNGCADWPRWARQLEEVRQSGAELIGAGTDEIALIRNTTEGINLVAEGFPWQPGDNVVLPADEFPSNLYPWMNLASRGVEARRVPIEQGHVDARPARRSLRRSHADHCRQLGRLRQRVAP